MPLPLRFFFVLALVASAIAPAAGHAQTTTTCTFGGPTPAFRIARIDLPTGSDFLGIEITAPRSSRIADRSSWHLAQGLYIINADSGVLEAYRVMSAGSSPRRVVARTDGQTHGSVEHPGPDLPFQHQANRLRAGLPPGSYYAVAFGTDGGSRFPNDWWSANVRVAGAHSCHQVGDGEVFDIDHTDFQGGTQFYAGPTGFAEGITTSFTTAHTMVVGLIDSSVQLAGEAETTFETPTTAGSVDDEIIPFVSTDGTYSFAAEYRGIAPLILVAGARITPTR